MRQICCKPSCCGESGGKTDTGNKDSNTTTANHKGTDSNTTGADEIGTTENSIVGTWKGEEAGETITYTFKADGTFSADYTSGTYTISGDHITLITNIGGQEIALFDNVSFSVNKNTLTMAEYTYTKQ